MRTQHVRIFGALLGMVLGSAAYAADAPAADAAPRNVTAPAGFKRETVKGVHLLIDPAEEAWIREAAAGFKPATQPIAGPAELAKALVKDRARIAAGLAADLGLGSDKDLLKYIDEKIVPALDKIEKGQPVFYYMPITDKKLKQVVEAGWNGSRPGLPADRVQFYYNRHADTVEYNPNYKWEEGQDADESVVPLLFDPAEQQTLRVKALTDRLIANEAGRDSRVILEGRRQLVHWFEKMIDEIGIKPLNLTRGQEWLGLGVQSMLVARYAAPLAGMEKDQLLREYATPAQNLVAPGTIDLTAPTDAKILREQVRPLYESAMRNKAVVVVAGWVKTKGDDVIAKTMAAVRAKKPADAKALVSLIQEVTGTDLGPDLRVRN